MQRPQRPSGETLQDLLICGFGGARSAYHRPALRRIDNDVDPSELPSDRLHGGDHRDAVGDITTDRQRGVGRRRELSGKGINLFLGAAESRHGGSLPRERLCDRGAEALPSPGDYRYPAREPTYQSQLNQSLNAAVTRCMHLITGEPTGLQEPAAVNTSSSLLDTVSPWHLGVSIDCWLRIDPQAPSR